MIIYINKKIIFKKFIIKLKLRIYFLNYLNGNKKFFYKFSSISSLKLKFI